MDTPTNPPNRAHAAAVAHDAAGATGRALRGLARGDLRPRQAGAGGRAALGQGLRLQARRAVAMAALALGWLMLPVLMPPAAAQGHAVRLPSLGDAGLDDFSLSAEKRLGEQIMREVRRDPDYLDDPQLLDHLLAIWQPLVKAARSRGDIGPDTDSLFPYELFLVRDRSVNAFALPGGYVGVHLGLVALTASRDELASVLAHELSHITRRHIARGVVASQRNSNLSLAASILALLAASRSANIDLAQAAIVGGQAAAMQSQLNFSRDMEREADRNGLVLLGLAGFAPQGMARMFEKLDQANRLNDSGGYPYLRSHPLTTERIGEARQAIDSVAPNAAAAQPEDPAALQHALMRARARVLMETGTQAWQRLQEQSLRGAQAELPLADRLAGLYAATLASLQLKDLAAAERHGQALRALAESQPVTDALAGRSLQRLQAQVALARGDTATARLALKDEPRPTSRAGLLLQAQLALAERSPQALGDSADALQLWLVDHRQDAGAWQLLGQLATLQGQELRAVRAEAEARAALGDLRGAIDRLRTGQLRAQQGRSKDFIEASVIDSRLRELQAARRSALADEPRKAGRPDGETPEDR